MTEGKDIRKERSGTGHSERDTGKQRTIYRGGIEGDREVGEIEKER